MGIPALSLLALFLLTVIDSGKMAEDLRRVDIEGRSPDSAINQLVSDVDSISTTSDQVTALKTLVSDSSVTLKDKINTYVTDSSALATLNSVFTVASNSFGKFTSNNAGDVVSGSLDMINAFAPLVGQLLGPGAGQIGLVLGAVTAFANGILSMLGVGTSLGGMIRGIINDALRQERIRELENQAHGAEQVFSTSKGYLDNIIAEKVILTDVEVNALATNMPVWSNVQFMGTLSSEMYRNCHQTSPSLSNAETCVTLSVLYANLGAMQLNLMMQAILYIEGLPHSSGTAAGYRGSYNARFTSIKNALLFYREATGPYCVPVSVYRKQNHPNMEKLLTTVGAPEDDQAKMNGKTYGLYPDRWTNWYMYVSQQNSGRGSKVPPLTSRNKFIFHRLDGRYWRLQVQADQCTQCYLGERINYDVVYFNNHIRGSCSYGFCADLIFIRMGPNRYMISSTMWPDKMMYMADRWDGELRTWKGDPGNQGYWTVVAA